MRKILLSAFACHPEKGSEPGYGWHWATGLAQENFDVHCITRLINKSTIERISPIKNVTFHYVALRWGLECFYSRSQTTMYLYYLLWQYKAFKVGKQVHKKYKIDIVHHVTWGNIQMGSFLYKLNLPFIFGPAGGGQKAPASFKHYFLKYWKSEINREKVGDFMVKYNPAFKKMVDSAHAVLVSNFDTSELVSQYRSKPITLSLDSALPESFFPLVFTPKTTVIGELKLLWVGRLMARKGLLLLLDVMAQLKDYPNIKLTIVGDGEMKQAIIDKINNEKLTSTVSMTGPVPYKDIKSYYAKHDVFTFTSLRDSGPSQLIEAMAYGMPVITINLHGQRVIVTESTGIVCSCETPFTTIDNFKKAILKLYENPGIITHMSGAAYEFARRQEWSHKIKEVVNNLYPKLI